MPAPGSVAEQEWSRYDRHAGYSTAFTILTAAADHMQGAAALLTDAKVHVWAPMALGRAAIEAAARVWCLCDPDISGDERVARGYALWWRAVGDVGRIPDLSPDATAGIHADLARRLEQHAVAHTLTDGKVTNVHGAHYPGAGDMLEEIYDDSGYARRVAGWLSGVAHADPWVLASSFAGEDTPEPGRRRLHTRVTTSVIAALGKATVVAYVRAVDRWMALMGWEDEWAKWSHGLPTRAQVLMEELT